MKSTHFVLKRLVAVAAAVLLGGMLKAGAQEYCTTLGASDVKVTSAVVSARLNVYYYSGIKNYGIQLSRDKNTQVSSGKRYTSNELNGDQEFSIRVSNLNHGTVYYYRAFVYDGSIYRVGEWKSFTTAKPSISITRINTYKLTSNSTTIQSHFTIKTPETFTGSYNLYFSEKDSTSQSLLRKENLVDYGKWDLSDGSFYHSESRRNLKYGTRYWCMFVIEAYGVSHKSELYSFVTPDLQPVDMGLPSGTLWSPCNVGALTTDEPGDAYLWGDPVPAEKGQYGNFLQSYKWFVWTKKGKVCKLGKYNFDTKAGSRDDKMQLEAQDDPATAALGGHWSSPTREQFQELIQHCTITRMSGTNVVRLTSNINKNVLYLALPQTQTTDGKKTSQGIYWTKSLSLTDPWMAGSAFILAPEGKESTIEMVETNRGIVASVRPVWNE